MRLILFVNDSYFAYLLGKPLIERFGNDVVAAVFSKRITGSWRKIWRIYRRTHWRYFLYRSLVDAISRVIGRRGKTVRGLLEGYAPRIVESTSLNPAELRKLAGTAELGVALNFDQVIPRAVLELFPRGVINLHASRLPADKGISPVLWAHARGDETIWTSIYRMDERVDCGELLVQYETGVEPGDSAFETYRKICAAGGEALSRALAQIARGELLPSRVVADKDGNYNGWPDATHRLALRRSGRRLWRVRDMIQVLKLER